MHAAKNWPASMKQWLSKSWAQWLLATIFFFLMSWLFMGSAITDCSTSSVALGSDSTGGFGWVQWAGGNNLTWGHTDKSNYPYGEDLTKPQFVTATLFIVPFKVLASLTTPICGINLMLLLGYMSSALVMFGFIRWLLKRFDIALFAGFAAAFVPFHQLKAESHINYVYGSFFIAMIWAYIWLLQRPSYKRAAVFGTISALGFYFDGYFILMSSLVLAGLYGSTLLLGLVRVLRNRQKPQKSIEQLVGRIKYLVAAAAILAVLLVPILVVYKTSGSKISQTLSMVRSDIKVETLTYGARPIEFVVPSYDSALLAGNVPSWLAAKPHGSNPSESTLYAGWTIIILAISALVYAVLARFRRLKLQETTYGELVLIMACVFLACFAFSLPALVTVLGHTFETPTYLLIKLTASWRALSRLFLAMHPALVVLASLGLYMLTKGFSKKWKAVVVGVCGILLFLEFLPSPLHPTSDLYKNAPPIYQEVRKDPHVNLIAEYPINSFLYTPEMFTFQQMHNKTLVNANDGSISVGPIHGSIAGLNDPQTLGVLKSMGVDMVITHGLKATNPGLDTYYRLSPALNADGTENTMATRYSYRINDSVTPRPAFLTVNEGSESLSVDQKQVSHRYVTNQATMQAQHTRAIAGSHQYLASFDVASACPNKASVIVSQNGRKLWSGSVDKRPVPIEFVVGDQPFQIHTAYCSIDITRLNALPL